MNKFGTRNAAIWNARALQACRFIKMQTAIIEDACRRNVARDFEPLRSTHHAPVEHDAPLSPWHPHYDARRTYG